MAAGGGGGLVPTPVEMAAGVGITISVSDKADYIPLFAQVIDLYGIMFTLDDVAKMCGLALVCFLIIDRGMAFKKGRKNAKNHSTTKRVDNP